MATDVRRDRLAPALVLGIGPTLHNVRGGADPLPRNLGCLAVSALLLVAGAALVRRPRHATGEAGFESR